VGQTNASHQIRAEREPRVPHPCRASVLEARVGQTNASHQIRAEREPAARIGSNPAQKSTQAHSVKPAKFRVTR